MLQRNNNISGLRKRASNPDENKTWDVAKKLGVSQELNLASEDVRRDFANGVKNASNVVKFKNLDTDHPDVLKYTEALIKKRQIFIRNTQKIIHWNRGLKKNLIPDRNRLSLMNLIKRK